MYDTTFAQRLIELVNRSGKSFNLIERELGYSRNALSNYKHSRIPSALRLVELAEYFGVSPEYLIGKSNEERVTFSEELFHSLNSVQKDEIYFLSKAWKQEEKNNENKLRGIDNLIATQCKITFPLDYDLNNIRESIIKVEKKDLDMNGQILKLDMIKKGNVSKEYCNLSFWNRTSAMNNFIFNGLYDHSIASFGWHRLETVIPLYLDLKEKFMKAKYIVEKEHKIEASLKMKYPKFSNLTPSNVGKILVYKSDTWKYVEYFFYQEKPTKVDANDNLYEVFNISTNQ